MFLSNLSNINIRAFETVSASAAVCVEFLSIETWLDKACLKVEKKNGVGMFET